MQHTHEGITLFHRSIPTARAFKFVVEATFLELVSVFICVHLRSSVVKKERGHSTPLVDGVPPSPRASAGRSARPTPLKQASTMW